MAFFIASNFVTHPQILTFSVFEIESVSPFWLQIKFEVSLFFYLFTFAISLCRTEENVETVNNLVLSQEDKLQSHMTSDSFYDFGAI